MIEFIVNPRRAPRAPSRCSVHAQAQAAQWDAETEDVGPHGCQLVAPAPLARGAAIQLALAGPGVKEPLAARGKVAWVSSQPPWRLGVAFEEEARPAATRWFELLVAARPGLGAFRRVPDRLPLDAMVFLGPPPRFADFVEEEVIVISHVASGITIAALRDQLQESWQVSQRALFALLSRGAITVARGAAAHPASWRAVMIGLGADFVAVTASSRTAPGTEAVTPPPLPLVAAEVPGTHPPEEPPRPAVAPAAAAPPTAQPGPPTAGTGWRGTGRTRSAEAQEAFELGRQELAEGRTKAALALLRRALQLAPGDAEVAAELGRAMKG